MRPPIPSIARFMASNISRAAAVSVSIDSIGFRRVGNSGQRAPISIGILSLLMTIITYVPGAIVGGFFGDGTRTYRIYRIPPADTHVADYLCTSA